MGANCIVCGESREIIIFIFCGHLLSWLVFSMDLPWPLWETLWETLQEMATLGKKLAGAFIRLTPVVVVFNLSLHWIPTNQKTLGQLGGKRIKVLIDMTGG